MGSPSCRTADRSMGSKRAIARNGKKEGEGLLNFEGGDRLCLCTLFKVKINVPLHSSSCLQKGNQSILRGRGRIEVSMSFAFLPSLPPPSPFSGKS